MTRTYAALRLLELGPLTFREFAEITGWPVKASRRIWKHLLYSCWISPVSRIGKCLCWGLNGLANTHQRAQAGPAPALLLDGRSGPGLRGLGSTGLREQEPGTASELGAQSKAARCQGKGEGQC